MIRSTSQKDYAINTSGDDVVISVKHLSKKFCRNLRRSMYYGILDLTKNIAGIKPDSTTLYKDEFWALDDISLELKRGKALGIMGANGSGKTTLLRVLTGIFPPDKGEVIVKGRVGALVAVGAGFHPHMTGRENIYLNGTILGMTRKEIKEQFGKITDFADIGDFLDAPVATYSSGMRVRLGFSIAVHCKPDILIADEVLAVGDYAFRMKCYSKMKQLLENCSVILVSHGEAAIRSVCQRVIILHKGRIIDVGDTDPMILKYRSMVVREQMVRRGGEDYLPRPFTTKTLRGYGEVQIKDIKLRDKHGELIRNNFDEYKPIEYAENNRINIAIEIEVIKKCFNPRIGIYLRDSTKSELTYVAGVSISRITQPEFQRLEKGKKRITAEIDISRLTPGIYTVIVAIGDEKYHYKIYDCIDDSNNITFEIVYSNEFRSADALINKPYFLPEYKFNITDL